MHRDKQKEVSWFSFFFSLSHFLYSSFFYRTFWVVWYILAVFPLLCFVSTSTLSIWPSHYLCHAKNRPLVKRSIKSLGLSQCFHLRLRLILILIRTFPPLFFFLFLLLRFLSLIYPMCSDDEIIIIRMTSLSSLLLFSTLSFIPLPNLLGLSISESLFHIFK